ncbi:SAM-dependent methyltransferase [Streptomyces sp. NPDC006267]|uniref:SAM-dependent methyltransferase n=1 Tax=Streptomyces sp. NPDC006267 TaxID=3157173 RepID=UPI0033A4402C
MTTALDRVRQLLDTPAPTVPGQLAADDRPLTVLDTYCCQGGASAGYAAAGFDVTGVDINPQPHYPFRFIQGDAVEYIREHGHEYDLIAGSPTCRRWTNAQRIQGNDHPDLITPTREAMKATGRPYIIENVEGAAGALIDPLLLCGAMFGLKTYRHRLFESSLPLGTKLHPRHTAPLAKMGRRPQPGEFMHVVGNFSGAEQARQVMGMPWATRDGLREAIPPAYTQFLGEQAAAQLKAVTA